MTYALTGSDIILYIHVIKWLNISKIYVHYRIDPLLSQKTVYILA